MPGSLRSGYRRSIQMTKTTITMRTTVPMPIYIEFPSWGDVCVRSFAHANVDYPARPVTF
jgi:hypothetical protein